MGGNVDDDIVGGKVDDTIGVDDDDAIGVDDDVVPSLPHSVVNNRGRRETGGLRINRSFIVDVLESPSVSSPAPCCWPRSSSTFRSGVYGSRRGCT